MAGKYQKYPEYKTSTVETLGVIPSAWDARKVRFLLKDGAEGIKIGPFGSALKLEDMVDSGIRVYGQENVIKKDFTLGKRRISPDKFSEMQGYQIYPKDLLITMMGTSGKCELVTEDVEKGIIDSHLLRLRVKENEISPSYFRLLIDECHEIESQIKISGKGSIMHGLNSSIVKALLLPLPSKSEQVKILDFLNHETARIDALINKQQQLIKLLKEKRQAVISHAVIKGLNPNAPMRDSGVEWLGEVPEHWDVVSVKYLSNFVGTGGTPKEDSSFSEVKDVHWFTPGDFNGEGTLTASSKYITEASCKKGDAKLYQGGSVLVIGIGATLGKVGFCLDNFSCNQQINIITPNKKIDGVFMMYSLSVQVEQMKQLSNFSTIGIMNQEKTKLIQITTPPISEQYEITKYVKKRSENFSNLLIKVQDQIALLQERRSALISAAVTGKIDVRNWQATASTIN